MLEKFRLKSAYIRLGIGGRGKARADFEQVLKG